MEHGRKLFVADCSLVWLVLVLAIVGAFAPNFPTRNEVWQTDVNAQGHKLLNLDISGSGVEASLGNPSVTGYVLSSTTAGVRSWVPPGGDYSSNTSTSVDGEVVLFSGTGGKTGKRATGTGIAKLTSGVLGLAIAKTDYWDTTNFVASGGSHAKGLVPDPGSSAGTTKFLREDATWVVPSGGGTPGGSDTQLQRNNAGAFGGTTGATSDGITLTLTTPIFTGLPTGSGVASSATASTLAARDANGNLSSDNLLLGYSTTATSAGTTTLTVGSNYEQVFTGSTTQTVVLPVTSTLIVGFPFQIVNNSTGTVTINSSGSNLVASLPGGTQVFLTCILTSGTTAASWQVDYSGLTAAAGKAFTIDGTSGSTLNIGAGGTLGSNAFTSTAYVPTTTTVGGTALSGNVTQDNITGLSSNGIIKRTGANTLVIATAATDYAAATTGSANTPLFNNGSGGFTNGTVSGNTTVLASTTGTLPNGNCVKIDANGNLVDSGAPCGGGGAAAWDGVVKVNGSDFTTTIQTLSDITGLVSSTLLNSTLYEIEIEIQGASTSSAGVQFAIHSSGTGTAATARVHLTGNQGGGGTVSAAFINAIDTPGTAIWTANNTGCTVGIKGFVTTSSTGTSTISVQCLKTTSGTATVSIGSVLKWRKV